MTTQTDRRSAQIFARLAGRTAPTPRRAADPTPQSPTLGARTAGLRSVGTYTLVAAAILGVGGYLVHSTITPEPASPAPVSRSRAPRPTVDQEPNLAAKPVQITVVTGPQQNRPAPAPGRETLTDTHRIVATDDRVVAGTANGRTLTWDSSQSVRAQQPRVAATTVKKAKGAKLQTGKPRRLSSHETPHSNAKNGTRELIYQIVAADGSIVYIGDDGRLVANTGATASSGVVALDVDGSSLASGTSRASSNAATSTASHGNSTFEQLAGGGSAVAVSGFEDHSVSVLGDDQIVTYDDSNVFINRNGHINANTGDTDSSGLNAVDVTNSRVRSGNSGDGEGGDENDEEAAEEQEAPTESKTANNGNASKDDAADQSSETASSDDSDATDDNDSDASDEAEDDADQTPTAKPGNPAATVTDEGASTADGDHPVVVGADGYDDVSIRSRGNRTMVTYDDSNVVIGGTGDVNAQIGDSDTGGAVVMGVHGSDVSAGCEGDLCQDNEK